MRYTLAVLLALGIGITTAISAALAQNGPGHVSGERPILEVRQATGTPEPQMSLADDYASSPSNPTPGFNTGYGTVVEPSQPLWVVQFPL